MASLLCAIILFFYFFNNGQAMEIIKLNEPVDDKTIYFKDLINKRYTVRDYRDTPLNIEDLSYILWAAYGFKKDGGRTVPSAGALYPLNLYVACGNLEIKKGEKAQKGLYAYEPHKHELVLIKNQDIRTHIARASLSQMWMAHAPCMIIITCEYSRITFKYRERGIRYAHMEVGNVSQNISLAAFNRGLACGIVGAFYDDDVKAVLGIKETHEPLLLMPIGYKK
ncbi:MAG: SagB/ThcOx family dehydrogenase [Syntrophorhabdaceae bacterium]|nr:SagB/ThcOx family dehydrogenase [Syntrophorhabdaceae bacterium]